MNGLEKISKQLEKTYEELENTIKQVNSLKDNINEISNATTKLSDIVKKLSENEDIKKLNKGRNEFAKSIREDIGLIKEHIEEIEIYRTYFEDTIKSYNQKLFQSNKEFTDNFDKTTSLSKELSLLTGKLTREIQENNKSRKRITEIAHEIELYNHYEEVKKEQAIQRLLLEKILKKINN